MEEKINKFCDCHLPTDEGRQALADLIAEVRRETRHDERITRLTSKYYPAELQRAVAATKPD